MPAEKPPRDDKKSARTEGGGFGSGAFGAGFFGGSEEEAPENGGPEGVARNISLEGSLTVSAQGGARLEIPLGHSLTVHDTIQAVDTSDAVLIPGVWAVQGVEILAAISRAEAELNALLLLADAHYSAQDQISRGHNGPPGLVDLPDIDVDAVETALVALTVLRRAATDRSPAPDLLELLWRSLQPGLRQIEILAAFIGAKGAHYLDNVLDGFTKSLGKSLGTAKGAAGWIALVGTLVTVKHTDLATLISTIQAVRAAVMGLGL